MAYLEGELIGVQKGGGGGYTSADLGTSENIYSGAFPQTWAGHTNIEDWKQEVKESALMALVHAPLWAGGAVAGPVSPAFDAVNALIYGARGKKDMRNLALTSAVLPSIIGGVGKPLISAVRAPISKAWTNIKNPAGSYSFPTLKETKNILQGKNWAMEAIESGKESSHSVLKGLKKAIWDDVPLWTKEMGGQIGKVPNEKALNLAAHKYAAEYHLNRALHNLKSKNFKGSFYYRSSPEDIKKFKFDIPRSDIFKTNLKPENLSDIAYSKTGKLWRYNTDNEYARKLEREWRNNSIIDGADPVVGGFGHDWKTIPMYRHFEFPPWKGKIPMHDRMFDKWDMALNKPTYKNIFSSKVKFARHYGSKALGLKEVKLIGNLSRRDREKRYTVLLYKKLQKSLDKLDPKAMAVNFADMPSFSSAPMGSISPTLWTVGTKDPSLGLGKFKDLTNYKKFKYKK